MERDMDMDDISVEVYAVAESVGRIATSIENALDGAFRIAQEFHPVKYPPVYLPAHPGDTQVSYYEGNGGWCTLSLPILAWEIQGDYIGPRSSTETPRQYEYMTLAASLSFRDGLVIHSSSGYGYLGRTRESVENQMNYKFNWRNDMLKVILNAHTLGKLDEESQYIDFSDFFDVSAYDAEDLSSVDLYRRVLDNWGKFTPDDTGKKAGEKSVDLHQVLTAYVKKYDELAAVNSEEAAK